MPRLPLASIPRCSLTLLSSPLRDGRAISATSPFSTTTASLAKDTNSTPGWGGRGSENHAVNRSQHDPQSEGAQQGIKDFEEGKGGGQAISRKDEGDANAKAKEDHPEAPWPVIGMNDEKGEVRPKNCFLPVHCTLHNDVSPRTLQVSSRNFLQLLACVCSTCQGVASCPGVGVCSVLFSICSRYLLRLLLSYSSRPRACCFETWEMSTLIPIAHGVNTLPLFGQYIPRLSTIQLDQ